MSLALARLPRQAVAGAPFTATVKIQSHVDRRLGPLRITLANEAAAAGPGSAASSPARSASGVRRTGGSGSGEAASRESSLHAAAAVAGIRTPLARSASAASDVSAAGAGAAGAAAAAVLPLLPSLAGVCLHGLQVVEVEEVGPRQAVEVQLQLLALAAGQQALPALALVGERDGKRFATLPPQELFVDSC